MSGVPRENGPGMEEKEPVVLLQENTSFDDDDEEVAVIQVRKYFPAQVCLLFLARKHDLTAQRAQVETTVQRKI